MTRLPVLLLCGVVLAGTPTRAVAQPPDGGAWRSRVSVGGELSANLAPRDESGYFNYADYEYDVLRTARLRLFGEWRVRNAVSLVAEARLDNGSGLVAPAWYVRWRPRAAWNLDVQVGRIPPVVGAYARRAYGRDNPMLGAPLAYQYLTSLRPRCAAPRRRRPARHARPRLAA